MHSGKCEVENACACLAKRAAVDR